MGTIKRFPEIVSIAWIALLTGAVVIFVLGNLGISSLAYPLALVLLACFLLVPVWAFIIRRDFALRLLNILVGQALPNVKWEKLSSTRRSAVWMCILLCLANALLLLFLALTHLF